MAKGVAHAGKGTHLSSGNAYENERRGWDEGSYRRKNENPTNNYDWSRHHLNFEIVDGKVQKLGSQKVSLYERYQNVLKEVNFTQYKTGATNQQNTYVEVILSGSTERMQELAFGDQEVDYTRNPETWHNWNVERLPAIEEWALDCYEFMCRMYGKENIIGFEVHLDETEPHIHANIVPTAIKKQRGNVGGYVKVDAEGNPMTYQKGKHIGEVIKLSKGKYDALSEEKKKEYRPAVRGTVRTISFAEYFGSTKAERSVKMSELHDKYYEQVGQKWGLERGDRWADLPEDEKRKRRRRTKQEAFDEKAAKEAKEKAVAEKEVAIQERDAVVAEVKQQNTIKEKNIGTIEGQQNTIKENSVKIIEQLDAISKNKREIREMEKASLFDRLKNDGINEDVRKAINEEENRHQKELVEAKKATTAEGKPITWKDTQKQLTWEEYARYEERQLTKEKEKAKKEKAQTVEEAKKELRETHAAEIEKLNDEHKEAIKKERYLYENGKVVTWGEGEKKGQPMRKDEALKFFLNGYKKYKSQSDSLSKRIKEAWELLKAVYSLNFQKVLAIIYDHIKRGMKEFSFEAKELLQNIIFADEKKTEGRRKYFDDAFKEAKLWSLLDPEWKGNFETKELKEDAYRIADGTWEEYHANNELEDSAVEAVANLANTPNRRCYDEEDIEAVYSYLESIPANERSAAIDRLWERADDEYTIKVDAWLKNVIGEIRNGSLGNGYGRGL